VHTQQDKAQSACSIDLPLHPAEAGTRPVQLALHLNRPCLSFYWPSTCNQLMTPLHTAHASISVAALMYARALVMVLPALSVLYVLKTNVQIMMLVQMTQQAYGSGNHVIMLSCKWALILVLPAAAFFLKDAGANALQPDQSCCAWPKQNSMCLF